MDASMLIDKNRITPSVLYAQCRSCFGYIKFFVSSLERIVLIYALFTLFEAVCLCFVEKHY